MTPIDLKSHVQRAVAAQWPAFAAAHPHLAAVIDQALLVEEASQRLAADPAFLAAMQRAAADQRGVIIAQSVEDFLARWLGRLL